MSTSESFLIKLAKIRFHPLFEGVAVIIIVFSAVVAGIKTFSTLSKYQDVFTILDYVISAIFLTELLIRFLAESNKKDFFKNGWNIFDSIIVLISLIPINNADLVVIGRMLRIFRIMRVISFVPELRILVSSIFRVLPKMGYILILLFIFFYIYATIGATFFSEINPDLWGNVALSMLTLFRVLTLEAWTDVMYEAMDVYPISWTYFVSFIIITAFAFLNLLIGVVVTVVEQETKNESEIEEIKKARENELVEGIKRLEQKLEQLKQNS